MAKQKTNRNRRDGLWKKLDILGVVSETAIWQYIWYGEASFQIYNDADRAFYESIKKVCANYFMRSKVNIQNRDQFFLAKTGRTMIETCKTGGFCVNCGREHWLGPGNTRLHCRELMHRLDKMGTIDFYATQPGSPAASATAPLFGTARGKMFGVMECLKPDGAATICYAFSGQYNGLWLVDGWAPPLFAIDDFLDITVDKEKQIKQLGREIDQCVPHSKEWLAQRKKRRQLSQNLMRDIHSLYRLTNFRGVTATLEEAFNNSKGIPTGTGDCCAPKLLNFAAENNLRPLGISEFFYGKENRTAEHLHGSFSSSCTEKCRPILGFMLCGLEQYPPINLL